MQANDVESLPESLLGTMRLNHLDLSAGALPQLSWRCLATQSSIPVLQQCVGSHNMH